jgi:hypothetical protein
MTRAGSSWRIAILRPGDDPIGNLAAALDAPEALGGPEGGDDLSRRLHETSLRASKQGLVECVRQARILPQDNVLVLIDQFEELQKNEAEQALVTVKEQGNKIERQNQALQEETRRVEEQRTEALLEKSRAEQEQAKAERQTRLTEEQRQVAEEQRQIALKQRQRAEAQERQARANEAAAKAASLEAEGRKNEAVRERQRADELRAQAESSEKDATRLGRLSLAHALALQVLRPAPDDERELNALLALAAYGLNRANRDRHGPQEDPDLFNALWTALLRLRGEKELVIGKDEDAVRAVVVDRVGAALITGGEDGKIRRLVDGSWQVLDSFGSGVRSLVAAENLLAAAFADGSVRVWEDAPGRPACSPGRERWEAPWPTPPPGACSPRGVGTAASASGPWKAPARLRCRSGEQGTGA